MTSQSKAYGYTLTIWGGGSILEIVYGKPSLVYTFLYVGGALAAFGVVLALAFDHPVADASRGDEIPVPSMIHLVATLGTLAVAVPFARAIGTTALPTSVCFLLVGVQLTLTYNLGLPIETGVVNWVLDRNEGSA